MYCRTTVRLAIESQTSFCYFTRIIIVLPVIVHVFGPEYLRESTPQWLTHDEKSWAYTSSGL